MEKNLKKDNIGNIILGYKAGVVENAEVIINYFESFINDYICLLKTGIFDIDNASLRNFLSVYGNGRKDKLSYYYYNNVTKSKFNHIALHLKETFSRFEEDELLSEIVCTLLEVSKKYDEEISEFDYYITRNFHYRLKVNLEKFLINNNDTQPLKYHKYNAYDFTNYIAKKADNENIHSRVKINKNYCQYDDKYIECFNWEQGLTCSSIFKKLNSFERYLLIEIFLNKRSETDIAIESGLSRRTINLKKKEVISILEKECEKLNLLVRSKETNE